MSWLLDIEKRNNTNYQARSADLLSSVICYKSNQPLADWICSPFRKQEFTSGIVNLVTGLLGGCCCCSAEQTWCVHPTALHMDLCSQIHGASFDQRNFFLQQSVFNSRNSSLITVLCVSGFGFTNEISILPPPRLG